MNPSTVAARVVLDELVRLGVREVVLAPGSRSAPLAYAAFDLAERGAVRLHVRVDERSAAFLALGLAKRSRQPAVVITTSGSAVANLHPAVLEAHHAGVPLILLTADRPPELRGVGANQATMQPGMLAPATRLDLDLETPADPDRQAPGWRTSIDRAHAAATGALSGAPGPAHLNLPFRDPLAPDTDEDESEGEEPAPHPAVTGRPDGSPWTAVVSSDEGAWAATRCPPVLPGAASLMVIGEVPAPRLRRAALAWADRHGIAVIAEPGPGSSHRVLPHGDLILAATDWVAAHLPTHLVVVGRPTLGRAVPALLRQVSGAGGRIDLVGACDPAADGWPDPTHLADSVLPPRSLEAIDPRDDLDPQTRLDDHPARPGESFARSWAEAGESLAAALATLDPGDRLDGPRVAQVLLEELPVGARLLLGSSSPARDVHTVARPREDVDVVTSRGLAGIDGLVSTAVGLALADPATPTAALLGDLTFLHDSNGLAIGPDEPRPDLRLVVVDDRGGSIFATLEYGAPERAAAFDRLFATPTGTDIAALAAAHRATVVQVEDEPGLRAALDAPLSGIEVVVVTIAGASHRRRITAERAAAVRQQLSG